MAGDEAKEGDQVVVVDRACGGEGYLTCWCLERENRCKEGEREGIARERERDLRLWWKLALPKMRKMKR